MNLSEYDKIWGESPKTEPKQANGEYAPLPKGSYKTTIEKCMWRENSFTNEPQLSFMFKIIDGQYAKRTIWKNCDLCMTRPSSIQYLRKDLNTLGWDDGSISNLKETDIFLDMEVEIAITYKTGKNGKEYPNVWINSAVKPEPETDIPF